MSGNSPTKAVEGFSLFQIEPCAKHGHNAPTPQVMPSPFAQQAHQVTRTSHKSPCPLGNNAHIFFMSIAAVRRGPACKSSMNPPCVVFQGTDWMIISAA